MRKQDQVNYNQLSTEGLQCTVHGSAFEVQCTGHDNGPFKRGYWRLTLLWTCAQFISLQAQFICYHLSDLCVCMLVLMCSSGIQ